MPIYEYRRPDGTTFEIQQAFSDETLTHDPETGVKVVRVLHAPAVHFKGKGFYNTDYGASTRPTRRDRAPRRALRRRAIPGPPLIPGPPIPRPRSRSPRRARPRRIR